MEDDILLRTIVKILTPFIFMFGLYVQFHGDYSPGGGFQAGVICAAAFISHALINGLNDLNRIISERTAMVIACMGVLLYGGTGVVALTKCGDFLDYSVLTEGKCISDSYKEKRTYEMVEVSKKEATPEGGMKNNIEDTKCKEVSDSDKSVFEAFDSSALQVLNSDKCAKTKVRIDSALHGQHIGILVIEAGVGLTVFSVMMLIFFVFAKRDS